MIVHYGKTWIWPARTGCVYGDLFVFVDKRHTSLLDMTALKRAGCLIHGSIACRLLSPTIYCVDADLKVVVRNCRIDGIPGDHVGPILLARSICLDLRVDGRETISGNCHSSNSKYILGGDELIRSYGRIISALYLPLCSQIIKKGS